MPEKYSIHDMYDFAAKKSGQCLSDAYYNTTTKLRWRCAYKHEWDARWSDIRRGRWCPRCADSCRGKRLRRYTIADMISAANKYGGTCLSTEFVSMHSKLVWECYAKHSWHATPSNVIHNRQWCPLCARASSPERMYAYSIDDLHQLAVFRGGRCLSSMYTGVKKKYLWECHMGHQWRSSADSVINGESWCPICSKGVSAAKHLKYSMEFIQDMARSRGGRCLSPDYLGLYKKLIWECAKEHQWEAIPNNLITHDAWCPECKVFLGERMCRTVFEQLFGVAFPKSKPSWLRSDKGRALELDGYAESLGLAFEHQGRQHYEDCDFFHGKYNRLFLDGLKKSLCAEHGVTLIPIPSVFEILGVEKLQGYIIAQCHALRVSLPKNCRSKQINLSKAYAESWLPLQLPLFEMSC